jgi:hypothetical protein
MRTSSNRLSCLAVLLLAPMVSASPARAPTAAPKPLFTQRPWLCVGGGFVAMVPLSRPQPLTVIRIGSNGIEAPQTIATTGNEVHGVTCSASYVELLVVREGSDHFSVLPFRMEGNAVQPEPREDINYSQKAPIPPEIDRRLQAFDDILNIRSDWYVELPRVNQPGHTYEVHFVNTQKGQDAFFAVSLLEETPPRKVIRSVPLVNLQVANVYD